MEEGNRDALFMDGARHAAWSEQANMDNYHFDYLEDDDEYPEDYEDY